MTRLRFCLLAPCLSSLWPFVTPATGRAGGSGPWNQVTLQHGGRGLLLYKVEGLDGPTYAAPGAGVALSAASGQAESIVTVPQLPGLWAESWLQVAHKGSAFHKKWMGWPDTTEKKIYALRSWHPPKSPCAAPSLSAAESVQQQNPAWCTAEQL